MVRVRGDRASPNTLTAVTMDKKDLHEMDRLGKIGMKWQLPIKTPTSSRIPGLNFLCSTPESIFKV